MTDLLFYMKEYSFVLAFNATDFELVYHPLLVASSWSTAYIRPCHWHTIHAVTESGDLNNFVENSTRGNAVFNECARMTRAYRRDNQNTSALSTYT